jgi:hypothetical protein
MMEQAWKPNTQEAAWAAQWGYIEGPVSKNNWTNRYNRWINKKIGTVPKYFP